MTTRRTRTSIIQGAQLAALMLCATLMPVAAQDYSPVVVVNDEIITGYDVDQRMRLLNAASAGSAVTREQATEQLIDDILRVQAARRAGIRPTQEQITAGFDELARNQNREPAAMRRYFESKGVSLKHLNKQTGAELAWRALIPATYMSRIRISDSEVDEAMGTVTAAPVEPEFLLSEIRLPIGAGGEQAARAQANSVVQALQSRSMTFGDLARQRSSGISASTGGDLGWVPLSTMTPEMRQIVSPMSRDRVSPPFVDGGDIVILGIRDTRGPGGGAAAGYRISQLVVGVAPDAAPSIASLALQKAQAAKARITDCASVEALKGEYLPISGSIGTLTPDRMPPAVRNTVLNLPVGGISEPIRSNDGFHVLVLCDKTETPGAAAATTDEDQVRRRLARTKLARYSASLLRKLRREAVIERR